MSVKRAVRERAAIDARRTECSSCKRDGIHVDNVDGLLISGDVQVTLDAEDGLLLVSGYVDGSSLHLTLCDDCAEVRS